MLKYDNFSSFIIFTEKLVMILKIGADFCKYFIYIFID